MAKEVIYRKISDLKKLPNNPRSIKREDMERLKKSVKNNPDYFEARPIILSNRTGDLVILAGNQRYEAAKALGMDEVPTFLLEGLTPEREREIIIRDNVSNGEWDMDVLANEWDTQELTDWGVDINWDEPEQEVIVDEAPEVNESEPADSVLGGVYQLGRHRLMCGDSTDAGSVAILMNGEKADMVFTDPPYRQETDGGPNGPIGKALKKQGSDIEFISDFDPQGFLTILPQQFEKNVLNAYIFCNKELLPDYLNWAVNNKYSYNVLVWKKPNAIPIGDSHRPDIEYLLLFRKNAIWNNGLDGVNYSRCLEYGRELGLHPTMKPLELICNEMKISSNKWSNVLDFFGGSGSTLIACEQLDRKCYMMELDPKYCDVIRKRYWKFVTGSEEGWQDGTKAV